MTEKEWKVKDLIKYLADFNPNAIIEEKLNIGWICYGGAEIPGERNIEKEKLDADYITLISYHQEFEN